MSDKMVVTDKMRLSTRSLKPDSLDPDSMWSRMSSTRHADYAHCTAGLDLMAHILSRSSRSTVTKHSTHTAQIFDQGCVDVKWSLDLDPQGSPICIGSRSKAPCGAPYYYTKAPVRSSKSLTLNPTAIIARAFIILLNVSLSPDKARAGTPRHAANVRR